MCNFSEAHPYRKSLLIPPGNIRTVKNLEDTRELWKEIMQESQTTLQKLGENATRLHKASTNDAEVEQIDVKVTVANEAVIAIVDSGANVDYVNARWCKEKGFEQKELGSGSMEGYDGRITQMRLKEATIPFEYQGKRFRQQFRIVEETGPDLLVLGMPWLKEENPEVDWQKRTVTLRKNNRRRARKSKQTQKEKNEEKLTQQGRGGYNKPEEGEQDYQARLKETREKLPAEIRDYAEVFCQQK